MQLNLVQTYFWVCDMFDKNPQWNYIRLSNNNQPVDFTDQEAVTIYLFVGKHQRYSKISDIHAFAYHYLRDWFPNLTSYQKFNNRLNVIYPIFYDIVLDIITNNIPENAQLNTLLIDSLPIVTCKGRNRTAKVARHCTDKGYCSTKNMYYYGLKLHLLAFRRPGTIPFPELIGITAASENDLTAFKNLFGDFIFNRVIFGDKIFSDQPYFDVKSVKQNIEMLTPIKLGKGESECVRQREKAYRNLFGAAVSKVRQPVESFFNWLNEKTQIQNAQKVRATKGLALHVFGKIEAAFIYLIPFTC